MCKRCLKLGFVVAVGALMLGFCAFGRDFSSYVTTSAGSVRDKVKDTVPIEFELQRARVMIDKIVPELQANIRLIAQEEVEIAALEKDIDRSRDEIDRQRQDVARMRSQLETRQVSYHEKGRGFTREQMTERLARRFERFKESKITLSGKQRLLEARRQSLAAAQTMLDSARQQKAELEQKIEGLVAQHRLIQASSVTSDLQVDGRQLTKADRLLADIQKRLEIAGRVLAHESDLFDVDAVVQWDESELLAEIDNHLRTDETQATVVAEATRGFDEELITE